MCDGLPADLTDGHNHLQRYENASKNKFVDDVTILFPLLTVCVCFHFFIDVVAVVVVVVGDDMVFFSE